MNVKRVTEVQITRLEDKIVVNNSNGASWAIPTSYPELDNSQLSAVACIAQALLTGTIADFMRHHQDLHFTLSVDYEVHDNY